MKTRHIGHAYHADIWAGKSLKEIALSRGIGHTSVINALKRADLPSYSEIRRRRNEAISELLKAAQAGEESLRHLGGALHADRLMNALAPFGIKKDI